MGKVVFVDLSAEKQRLQISGGEIGVLVYKSSLKMRNKV